MCAVIFRQHTHLDKHCPSALDDSMHTFGRILLWAVVFTSCHLTAESTEPQFRAGAAQVDIGPESFPVRVNAMFTERSADRVEDTLYAKSIALDDGRQRILFCVVDTCMIARDLIDEAKQMTSEATGVPTDHMLVSASHTHSAPSAMGCLGSRMDPGYAAMLPAKISSAMVHAFERLEPARIGWAQMDDWDHTFNRRWVRRPDRVFADPFGVPNVRAHMHPGHESPDAVGPSGPVDPELSALALQSLDGRPLALLANYSMHYYGSPLLSSDYFGRFAGYVGEFLEADEDFVAIMSQGTSGDLMWMDYGSPRKDIGYDAYAREIADEVTGLVKNLDWKATAPLGMAQDTLKLSYRTPSPERLDWSKQKAAEFEGRLPQSLPEIYALESIYLHEKQETELILQALRIGDLGVTAIPNEVYALTGLKLKKQSPFASTFNIELANGAEGYIPPTEQHALGGYTTWAARTAGLEVEAESKIVEMLLGLMEEVSGQQRRSVESIPGPYTTSVLKSDPKAYWRLEEMNIPVARDETGQNHGRFEDGVALYLPGADDRRGHQPAQPLTQNAFSANGINRSAHFAGGRLRSDLCLGEDYTVEFWLWNGLPADARPVTGYVYSRGTDGVEGGPGEHLGIGGTHMPHLAGRLFLFNGNERNQVIGGRTTLALRAWHHVAMVREKNQVRVYLDGNTEPEIDGIFEHTTPQNESAFFMGGRSDDMFNFEGKLDEIAIYDRALSAEEIATHYKASSLTPPVKVAATGPTSPALSPEESLKKIHVREGFQVELMASEPLTVDPVAIDWDTLGRLWVVEMSDYPLGMDGNGSAGGRVRMLEDSNGDGKYDRSTLFVDGLTFPTGILVWRDGVIVTAAPEVVFLRDTDQDGKADDRQVLISGLSTSNQQLRANGLRWGLDGWVYCAAGGHHGNFANGTRLKTRLGEILVGSRDFRFRPDTGELEPLSGPSQNGRNRDDWGHWFGTQNIRPLWHYVLPDRYLRRQPHIASPSPVQLVITPLSPKVYPASPPEKRFHSFDQAGHFTSACGGMIYRDNFLFPEFNGAQHAFTCEPFHNLVQHNLVTDDGVSFTARRDAAEGTLDFFASEDSWCRPVMTRTGPDGALWVVDMYRYMIEHPDWLPAEGRDELAPNYRIGDDRGRIYRVVPKKASASRPAPKLDQLCVSDLVGALDSPNGWQRDRVHMMLSWKSDPACIEPLERLVKSSANAVARVHALWLLKELGGLTPKHILTGLKHPHPGVRENALQLAESIHDVSVIRAAAELVNDPDPKARLQLAFTLGEWDVPLAGEALGHLAIKYADQNFMQAAVLSSATPHLKTLADVVAKSDPNIQGTLWKSLLELAFALNERATLASLLERVFVTSNGALFSTDQYAAATAFFNLAARRDVSLVDWAQENDALGKLLFHGMLDNEGSIFVSARKTVVQASADMELRAAAAKCLGRDVEHRSEALEALTQLLNPRQPVSVQEAALEGLASMEDASVSIKALERWPTLSPSTRAKALEIMLSREPWTLALLGHIGEGHDIPLDTAQRERLLRHGSARVRELAAQTLTIPSNRAQVIESFRPALNLSGDAGRGRAVYERSCMVCHRKGNLGVDVGPDLASVAQHPAEKLLANILDPSADIQPGYHAYQCELTDDSQIYGIITSETGNSLTFKLPDGTESIILRSDIRELSGGNRSLMPDGLEAGMTQQDMADLIQWLRTGE